MTVLDARASLTAFDMSNGILVNFDTYLNNNSIYYSWMTTPGTNPANYVHAFGSGIAVDPNTFFPTGGAITSLKIDIEHDGNPSTDVGIDAQITPATPVQLTALLSPAGTDPQRAADKFWEALLAGNDTIKAPDIGRSFLFGDFLSIFSSPLVDEEKTGGNDIMTANATGGASGIVSIGTRGSVGNALVGDAYDVAGSAFHNIAYEGILHGGRDNISLTGLFAYNLIGDAFTVEELGVVYGGNDIIRSDATGGFTGFAATNVLAGDVFDNGGFVTGGNDTITGSNFAFLDERLAGDVWGQTGATTGGSDAISGRAGHDYIAGDVGLATGGVTGGRDVLSGGEDADIIAGDVLQAGDGGMFGSLGLGGSPIAFRVVGGNDTINGDQGNDIIAGDIYAFGTIAAGSSIRGGSDVIHGGDGDDTIYGDFGPFVGLVQANFVGPGGNDTIFGDNGADTIFGDSGNDRIDGGADNDDLSGGTGADTLVGGAGDDTLDGGSNPANQGDVMLGGTGNDTYKVDSGLDLVDEDIAFPGYGHGGTDTIVSTADFFWDVYSVGEIDQVSAAVVDAGNDGVTFIGGIFDNTLTGHKGTDILFGRGGSDTYRAGDGVDYISLSTLGLTNQNAYVGVDGHNTVIVDPRASGPNSYDIVYEFDPLRDKIDVSHYTGAHDYTSAAQVLTHAVNDGAGNVYFALGDGFDYLYLIGLEKADLLASDFIV